MPICYVCKRNVRHGKYDGIKGWICKTCIIKKVKKLGEVNKMQNKIIFIPKILMDVIELKRKVSLMEILLGYSPKSASLPFVMGEISDIATKIRSWM